MRILISNDDGIHAPGLHALAGVAREFGDVVIVAPNRQRSASSHGITLHDHLYVNRVDFGMDNTEAYSLSGTPVDCVKWAVSVLAETLTFDVMLSGINEGPNLATDVLYSGTLAAAGEAALHQIPAIAFSLLGPPFAYADAAAAASRLIRALLNVEFPADTFVNVNFPLSNLRNARWAVTQLGARRYVDTFLPETDEAGQTYYRYAGEALTEVGGPDTDVVTVDNGDISLTPLRYHFTNDAMIATLRSALANQDELCR